ncbi:hypothetical protein A2U01_0047283, partial [Trifolium medium]|nr:hypothetical protein [Trifolium medium]
MADECEMLAMDSFLPQFEVTDPWIGENDLSK